MDHAETVAQRLLEAVLIGTRMVYRVNQSRGEHDFDLHYPDGRVSAVEVTSSVDEGGERTNAAILDKRKGGPAVKTKLCEKDWYVHPVPGANINKIRDKIDEYIAAIESAGIEKFFFFSQKDHPSVERIYADLGVVSGSVFPYWKEPGFIKIAPPGGGGALNASTVIEAVEREAFKNDNRRKLGASGAAERHLAVYVYMTNYLPWGGLVDFEPPSDLPKLPSEITDIWAFSETRSDHEYVVWRASTSLGWRRVGLLRWEATNPPR
jgi:hypothetical protein